MLLRHALLGLFCIAAFASCNGDNNDAANDLQASFQGGCSTNNNLSQVALSQTQALIATIQDLQNKASCTGLNSALNGAQSLTSAITNLNQDPLATQLGSLQQNQNQLLAQISAATDPTTMENLSEAYTTNAEEIAELQGQEATTAGTRQTPLQIGYTQVGSYVSNLLQTQSDLSDCARNNPLFAAQLGSQILSVAGSFLTPTVGVALSLSGAIISDLLGVIQDASYNDAIDQLNLVTMTTSLSCGLEAMSNTYCQAQDMMSLTALEECGYNPNSHPNCPKATPAPDGVSTTDFWRGLDILSRNIPALQIWVNSVVSGAPPADIYDAQRQNNPSAAQATMQQVGRNAAGWIAQETAAINAIGAANPSDQRTETIRALSTLVSYLACDNPYSSSNGGCGPGTPIQNYYSIPAILYYLVGQKFNCSDQNCLPANGIPLPGDGPGSALGNGGWSVIVGNEAALFAEITTNIDTQVHAALDVDPSEILEAAKITAGAGLPTPYEALLNISSFLQSSHDFFTTVPVALINGGEAGRTGTLDLLASTKTMLDTVATQVISSKGDPVADEKILKTIYTTLQLAQDPNFISERLTSQIRIDVNTRIKAGQIPKTAAEILMANETDSATQLTAVAPDQIEQTKAGLGAAITTSQLNIASYVTYYSKALTNVLTLLKTNADSNHEPAGGSPQNAPFRSSQARICILIAASQSVWPAGVDPTLCNGTFYQSDLTGEKLVFDDLYALMLQPTSAVQDRMCTFYNFYKNSTNFTHVK